jgi:hypothetical protein
MSQFNKYLEIVQEGKDYQYNEFFGFFKRKSLNLKEIEFLEKFHEAHRKEKNILSDKRQDFEIDPKTNFTSVYGVNSTKMKKLFEGMNKIIQPTDTLDSLILTMSDNSSTQNNSVKYVISLNLKAIRLFLADMAEQINDDLRGKKDDKKIEEAMEKENALTTRYRLLNLYRYF